VLDAVKRVSGVDFAVQMQARRPGDAPMLVADVSKAGSVLDWSLNHSDLDTIVGTAWNWHKSQAER